MFSLAFLGASCRYSCSGQSSTSRTFWVRDLGEKGFSMKYTPLSKTPCGAKMSAVYPDMKKTSKP